MEARLDRVSGYCKLHQAAASPPTNIRPWPNATFQRSWIMIQLPQGEEQGMVTTVSPHSTAIYFWKQARHPMNGRRVKLRSISHHPSRQPGAAFGDWVAAPIPLWPASRNPRRREARSDPPRRPTPAAPVFGSAAVGGGGLCAGPFPRPCARRRRSSPSRRCAWPCRCSAPGRANSWRREAERWRRAADVEGPPGSGGRRCCCGGPAAGETRRRPFDTRRGGGSGAATA